MNEQTAQGWLVPGDYRVICRCQLHARSDRRVWNKLASWSSSGTRYLTRSGMALLVGVPLAVGVGDARTQAMLRLPSLASSGTPGASQAPAAMTRALNVSSSRATETVGPIELSLVEQDFFRSEVPYGSIILAEAARNHLAPELVAAVIEAESDFRPRLISGKNAQGLMQIVPSTGKLLGVQNLFNPSENVAAGAKYLRYLFDRFPEERVALAAYNAGEGNVERFAGVPPFPETLTYVERVAARRQQYHQRVRVRYVAALKIQHARLQ